MGSYHQQCWHWERIRSMGECGGGDDRKCCVIKRWKEGLYESKRRRKQVNKQSKETQNISHSAMDIKIMRFRISFHRLGNKYKPRAKKHKQTQCTLRQLDKVPETRDFDRTGLRPSHVWAVFFCSLSFLNFLVLCLILRGPSLLLMTAS